MKKFSLGFGFANGIVPIILTAFAFILASAGCELLSADKGEDGVEETLPSGPPEEFILCRDVPEHIGEKDIWVEGYIIGGDLTSSSMSLAPPFRSSTNMAIAASPIEVEKDSCISVQLPKGAIRDSLNLVSKPENLWKKIFIRGDIVSAYYGIPGIKDVSGYYFSLNY